MSDICGYGSGKSNLANGDSLGVPSCNEIFLEKQVFDEVAETILFKALRRNIMRARHLPHRGRTNAKDRERVSRASSLLKRYESLEELNFLYTKA
jgi:hypothetical protein